MKIQVSELSSGWKWKERDVSIDGVWDEISLTSSQGLEDSKKGWRDVHMMPSEIHVELRKSGEIEDPYIGFNEHKIQCESQRVQAISKI